MEQRVLTYAEYEALGYKLYQDYRAPIQTGSTLKLNWFDVAYRADTKEQYAADYLYGIVKVTVAISSGGLSAGLQTGSAYLFSLV